MSGEGSDEIFAGYNRSGIFLKDSISNFEKVNGMLSGYFSENKDSKNFFCVENMNDCYFDTSKSYSSLKYFRAFTTEQDCKEKETEFNNYNWYLCYNERNYNWGGIEGKFSRLFKC